MTPDFIGRYEIDKSICESVIDEFERNAPYHIDKSKEDYGYVTIAENWLNPSIMDKKVTDGYLTELDKCIRKYIEEYEYSSKKKNYFSLDPYMNVQRYNPGNYYSAWHGENSGFVEHANRHLVFMTYLNDVKKGGETEFFYQKLKIKPKKGLTLIWPTAWMFTHKGVPAPKEKKYITTGWYIFHTWRAVPYE